MAQPQTKSGPAPLGKSSQGTSRVTRVLALIAASIAIVLAAAGALFQQPHPDPFRVTQAWDVFYLNGGR